MLHFLVRLQIKQNQVKMNRWFAERKTRVPVGKPLRAGYRTLKFNPNKASSPELNPVHIINTSPEAHVMRQPRSQGFSLPRRRKALGRGWSLDFKKKN